MKLPRDKCIAQALYFPQFLTKKVSRQKECKDFYRFIKHLSSLHSLSNKDTSTIKKMETTVGGILPQGSMFVICLSHMIVL